MKYNKIQKAWKEKIPQSFRTMSDKVIKDLRFDELVQLNANKAHLDWR